MAEGKKKGFKRKPKLQDKALEENFVGRKILFQQARKLVKAKSGGHYPAPLAILDVVEHGMSKGMTEGLKLEAKEFAKLGVGEVSKGLITAILFFTKAKCYTKNINNEIMAGHLL